LKSFTVVTATSFGTPLSWYLLFDITFDLSYSHDVLFVFCIQFVDFVAIFVRLVIILTENSQEKKKNRR